MDTEPGGSGWLCSGGRGRMMKTSNYDRLFFLGAVCFVLLFFVLNVYTPFIADDYSYSLGIHSVNDVLVSQYNQYFSWGGRCIAHFFAQFWLLIGKPFFNIANTIVYCVFIFLIQFHITGKIKKPNPKLFLAINIFFWFFTPAWGQNFLWLTGSCNYLWTTTIVLFFLVPFRKRHDNPDYNINVLFSALFFFVSICAGWSNENSGAAVLFLLLVYFITKIISKHKCAIFEVLGIIGFLAGFLFLIAAPGNNVRIESIKREGWGHYNEPLVIMLIHRFIETSKVFLKNYGVLFIAVSILLGLFLVFHQKRKLSIFSYFYFIAVLAGTYSMILAPSFADRSFLIVTVFSVIAIGNIVIQMEFRMPRIPILKIIKLNDFLFTLGIEFRIIKKNAVHIVTTVMIVVVLILFSFSFLIASQKVIGVYLRWYDRVEYIFAEKERGILEIETRPILTYNKHIALHGLEDIHSDKNRWPNLSIAEYYGLKSIKSDSKPMETLWLEKRKRIRQMITPLWKLIRSHTNPANNIIIKEDNA
jgi:hypothetical protein